MSTINKKILYIIFTFCLLLFTFFPIINATVGMLYNVFVEEEDYDFFDAKKLSQQKNKDVN